MKCLRRTRAYSTVEDGARTPYSVHSTLSPILPSSCQSCAGPVSRLHYTFALPSLPGPFAFQLVLVNLWAQYSSLHNTVGLGLEGEVWGPGWGFERYFWEVRCYWSRVNGLPMSLRLYPGTNGPLNAGKERAGEGFLLMLSCRNNQRRASCVFFTSIHACNSRLRLRG